MCIARLLAEAILTVMLPGAANSPYTKPTSSSHHQYRNPHLTLRRDREPLVYRLSLNPILTCF
jgi:hypothetical protein